MRFYKFSELWKNNKGVRFWRFALLKKCFDFGIGVTSYFTKVLMVVGFAAIMGGMDVKTTLLFGIGYTLFCFILGFFWIILGLVDAEQEVGNIFNLFVKQMRRKILKKKNI